MTRVAYPTDLSEAEFACLAPLLPPPKARGRPRKHPVREVLDSLFYLVRAGCQWRLLPREFPPWQTVYHWFRQWRRDGTWERVHTGMRRTASRRPRGNTRRSGRRAAYSHSASVGSRAPAHAQ